MRSSHRPRRGRRLVLASLVATLALPACGGGAGGGGGGEHEAHEEDSAPAFEEGAATTKIPVTLQDYAFVGVPASAKGPNVLFEATVKGGNEHELVVQDAAGGTAGVLAPFKSGKSKSLAVTLQPGTYTLVCLVREGAKPHADLGMKAELRVD